MAIRAGTRAITGFLGKRGIGFGHVAALGGSVWAGHAEYSRAVKEGQGTGSALMRGAAEGLMVDILGLPVYAGLHLMAGAPRAATGAMEALGQYSRGLQQERPNMPFRNNTFMDTQQTYTMRQAGMQLAQRSRHNLQHALLGDEAKHMHR